MKRIFFILAFLGFTTGFAQKTIYESKRFDQLSKDHKTLAIVPFLATLHLEHTDNISREQMNELQATEGYAVQEALESYFSQKKNRKGFRVGFQNIKNTNAILSKNGITLDNIDIHTTEDLCKILGVDGIISGNMTLSKLISKGVENPGFFDIVSGKSDYGRIAIKLSDGDTGKLLWKFEKTMTRKSGKNTRDIIESIMKKASRKFPYEK
ncbi:hypothetical protein [Sinomicrobium soli]|uniref:hypothetical protein n=1 Tax=Sinomicrobium sp. N-1-3-6 TaxID=2219864 RepID=UPI000DCEEF8A|nr:hypothetical protein [Sinomicrobium sp. N-1-3-6]RAV27518.1 hypothetical protein DN748_18290 [Sinomicrobium sp. N-1-3-6]